MRKIAITQGGQGESSQILEVLIDRMPVQTKEVEGGNTKYISPVTQAQKILSTYRGK